MYAEKMHWTISALLMTVVCKPSQGAISELGKKCEPSSSSHCYTLFKSSDFIYADQVDNHCKGIGQDLVFIPDQAVQDVIEDLLSNVFVDNFILTSGKNSGQETWWTLNATQYEGTTPGEKENREGIILTKKNDRIRVDSLSRWAALYPLCQVERTGGCVDEVSYGGLCYKVLPNKQDWYTAVSECQQYADGATLAYTDVLSETFKDAISSSISDDSSVWLGIFNQPWFWNRRSVFQGVWVMTYYNWADIGSSDPGNPANTKYVSISESNDFKWVSSETSSYKYFICENDPALPPDPITSPAEKTTQPTTTQTSGVQISQLGKKCEPSNSSYCYTLFKSSDFIYADQVDNHCKGIGQDLVFIPDQAAQDVIEELLSKSFVDNHILTSGKNSGQETWWTLNASQYEGTTPGDKENREAIILTKKNDKIRVDSSSRWVAIYPLCQVERTGGCVDEVSYGGLCYKVLPNKQDWYTAVSKCQQYADGATLAYTDVLTETFKDAISSSISDDSRVWLGIFNQPWFWNRRSVFKGAWVMTYYNWADIGSSDPGNPTKTKYVSISESNDFKWVSSETSSYEYFMCENDPALPPDPTTIPPEETIQSTTTQTSGGKLMATPQLMTWWIYLMLWLFYTY